LAENLYKLIEKARETASTADAKQYGVEIAIVTNVQDPDQLGRVKVCFPRLPGKPESSWCRVVQPAAGAGRGFYWLPHVNDEVLIAFERGEAQCPYVVGSLWNGKDKPMKDAITDENTTHMIQTKSGHQIAFSDKAGEELILIGDKSGKRTVTFDVKSKKFFIEAAEGDVVITAEKKIVFECADLEVKVSKNAQVKTGANFDLKTGGNANIQASSSMDMKGSTVSLNPPGGGGGGGGGGFAAAAAAVARAVLAAATPAAAKASGGGGGASGGAAAGAGSSAIVPTSNVAPAAAPSKASSASHCCR